MENGPQSLLFGIGPEEEEDLVNQEKAGIHRNRIRQRRRRRKRKRRRRKKEEDAPISFKPCVELCDEK
jgi:hypothetical protein